MQSTSNIEIVESSDGETCNVTVTRDQRRQCGESATKEGQRISRVELVELTDIASCTVPGTRDQRSQCEESACEEKQRDSKVEIVELSDDEPDSEVGNGHQAFENSSSSLWYVMDPYGQIMSPKPMSLLKVWGQTVKLKFKVWEKGKREEDAILLEDAIRQNFPDM